VANDLDQQLSQLDELLGLLDAKALRSAQEALEHRIAELTERLEVTRQALSQAQSQRKRLARARLLLDDDSTHENGSNGDPALHYKESAVEPENAVELENAPARTTAPFVAERRRAATERRSNGDRRDVEDRRSKT
jgi:hypothetical protein